MARQSQNILRRQVSKKSYIIIFSVLFFLLFLLVSYFGYRVLNYEYVHGQVDDFGGYVLAVSDSSPFQLPFFNALGVTRWAAFCYSILRYGGFIYP